MTEEGVKEAGKAKGPVPLKIMFKCQRCGKQKKLEDMMTITRFVPVLVVCRDCEKEMR